MGVGVPITRTNVQLSLQTASPPFNLTFIIEEQQLQTATILLFCANGGLTEYFFRISFWSGLNVYDNILIQANFCICSPSLLGLRLSCGVCCKDTDLQLRTSLSPSSSPPSLQYTDTDTGPGAHFWFSGQNHFKSSWFILTQWIISSFYTAQRNVLALKTHLLCFLTFFVVV